MWYGQIPNYYNTTTPYKVLEDQEIEYQVCRDFDHISRYKGLRQVAHMPESYDRYISLEVANPFTTHAEIQYYDVPGYQENRLDLIANQFLGSAQYSWIIAMFNDIEDGFTVHAGQRIMIPKSFTALFNDGEILAPVSALRLNLGSE